MLPLRVQCELEDGDSLQVELVRLIANWAIEAERLRADDESRRADRERRRGDE